jgi:hypothetical protein
MCDARHQFWEPALSHGCPRGLWAGEGRSCSHALVAVRPVTDLLRIANCLLLRPCQLSPSREGFLSAPRQHDRTGTAAALPPQPGAVRALFAVPRRRPAGLFPLSALIQNRWFKQNTDDNHPVQQGARHETTRKPFFHAHPPRSVRSNPSANPTCLQDRANVARQGFGIVCIAELTARSRTGHQRSNSEISCLDKQTNNRRSAG